MILNVQPYFYYTYVLFSHKDKKLYVGYTSDLENRILQHQQSQVLSTKNRLPLELIHFEAFRDKRDAKVREVFLKSGFGRNELKISLYNHLEKLGYKFLHKV